MADTPFGIVGNQVESALKNRAQAAAAGVRRETSIVGQAHRMLGSLAPAAATGKKRKRAPKSGVYVGSGAAPAQVAPDGYVRRSPVQAMRVDPGYYKKRAKRIIGACVAFLLVGAVVYILLIRLGIN